MSEALVPQTLSRDEARSLTDEVKHDAERLWRKLVELYDGEAHLALGYSSWGAYFSTEFGGSRTRAYELLNAGRVLDSVRNSGLTITPTNEAQANELTPLLRQPEQLREAWQEVIEEHPEPTAAQVREVVQRRVEPRPAPIVTAINEDLLERQQRETLIEGLDRAVYALEGPPSTARAEALRLLAGGDAGPFTPERFDRVAAYAVAFAETLREEGTSG